MPLLFLAPMFDNRVSMFGVPAALLTTVLAVGGFVIGLIVILRVTSYSDDAHAFRATNRRGSVVDRVLLAVAVIAVGLLFALVVASLLLRR
jgi:hypothetical protein